ncbi:hypothetical protein SCLCIDRAFT_34790 [Scleroderma citrinum Foug A]|uniref:Uncharacterized protein n=1 Tax=Scleroderma citrinum Foug A TaxID=1036808 RepID=A0A0C3D0S3_9AGAM|nr:hypothetical protein SCLCIDRAFT_34790 [Scleroderma citrinum Foug A]
MGKELDFGSGEPLKSDEVKDKSRFRESESEQTRCKVKRTGLLQMSEQTGNLKEGTICENRESNDFRDGAEGPEF